MADRCIFGNNSRRRKSDRLQLLYNYNCNKASSSHALIKCFMNLNNSKNSQLKQYKCKTSSFFNANSIMKVFNSPSRVLDAPGLLDDFYLNLISLSVNGSLFVGLGPNAYVWNAVSKKSSLIAKIPETSSLSYFSSIKACKNDRLACLGTSLGEVQLVHTESSQVLCTFPDFQSNMDRVSSLEQIEENLFAAGCKSGKIKFFDFRINNTSPQIVARSHSREVCGLSKCSLNANAIVSGGNDNKFVIWDKRNLFSAQSETIGHCAAVKVNIICFVIN